MMLSKRPGACRLRAAIAVIVAPLAALLAAPLPAAGALAPAAGQDDPRAHYPPGAVVQPLDESGGAALRGYLTRIAGNPRDLDALIGAGGEAVRMGDVDAALGFYSRAQEIAPRDPRVFAGLGSTLVAAERPREALDLFRRAVDLGADPAGIAADRGLAYDMLGDNARALESYRLAQRAGDSAQIRRRLALALAIGGQRAEALRVIDGDLRANDRAAWRVQAFVLALTGDAAGAEDTARRVMPPGTAERMAPFLARLASLTPAQKAMAVHFGQFPAQGSAQAAARPPARPPEQLASRSSPPARATMAEEDERRFPTPLTRYAQPPRRTLADVLRGQGEAGASAPAPAPAAVAAAPPRPARRFEPPAEGDGGLAIAPRDSSPATTRVPEFADVAAAVRALPAEVTLNPPPPRPATTSPPARSTAAPTRNAAPPPRRRPARPAHPSRHWVQVATGPNRDALPREFARLRARAPEQLRGRQAWTTPLGATNRLLVGPLASARDAQALVNALAARDVGAFVWTSEAGQEIDRLQVDDSRTNPASTRARGRSTANERAPSSRGRSRH